MAKIFCGRRQHGRALGTYRAFVRNLIFYTGVKQDDLVDETEAAEFLSRPTRSSASCRSTCSSRSSAITACASAALGEVLYFNPSAVRLRTLLSPEPERDLERVVLVTNQ